MGRAGPGRAWIIFCGPGRVRAWNLKARAGPGPVNINFAGRGPGLGLTFPGLGRARAYSESHYYFNIMVKDYLHLSIAKDHCFLCCKCNCTMQCISMASSLPANLLSIQYSTMVLNCWTSGEHIVKKPSDWLSKYGSTKLTQSFDDYLYTGERWCSQCPHYPHFPLSACRVADQLTCFQLLIS